MDSYTTGNRLLHLFYFLQLPSLQYYIEVRLATYYIYFEDYIDFLLFQLHSRIALFEILYFLYFRPVKYVHIRRVLLFTLFIIIVATAFIPISPSPSASHCISLAIKSLSENAIFFTSIILLYFLYYVFVPYCNFIYKNKNSESYFLSFYLISSPFATFSCAFSIGIQFDCICDSLFISISLYFLVKLLY